MSNNKMIHSKQEADKKNDGYKYELYNTVKDSHTLIMYQI